MTQLDLQRILAEVDDGYIRVAHHPNIALSIFNYTAKAQYERHWTPETLMCRGLILCDGTYDVVARPFDKFFNWLECGYTSDGHIVTVTEKMDGSLGILYRWRDQFAIATRGSFDGDQAQWATEKLRDHYRYNLKDLPEEWTLLFEIVYPENRIVVDYGKTEALYLLGIRNRHTGRDLPFYPHVYEVAQAYGFPTPRTFNFDSVMDLIAATDDLPATIEGWVVLFSDGQRFKFKGDRYVELHRLVTNASFKRVLESTRDGRYEQMVADVPDEFLVQIREWHKEIMNKVECTEARINLVMRDAQPSWTRKQFALWAQANHQQLLPYLFAALDDRPVRPLIFKTEFD